MCFLNTIFIQTCVMILIAFLQGSTWAAPSACRAVSPLLGALSPTSSGEDQNAEQEMYLHLSCCHLHELLLVHTWCKWGPIHFRQPRITFSRGQGQTAEAVAALANAAKSIFSRVRPLNLCASGPHLLCICPFIFAQTLSSGPVFFWVSALALMQYSSWLGCHIAAEDSATDKWP